MHFCDLCGMEDGDKIRNIKSNKADFDMLLQFLWIVRKKRTKEKMLLNVVCNNCNLKMTNLVKAVNEMWSLYNVNKNTQRGSNDDLYILTNDQEIVSKDIDFETIKDVKLKCQLENSVRAEGCTQLEWLNDSELYNNDSHSDCIDNAVKENSEVTENNEDILNYKENKNVATSRKCGKSLYSVALTEFSREFIIKSEDGKTLTCTLCNKILPSSKDRVHHIRKSHLHERPFSCQICKKKFTTRRLLNHHTKFVHSGKTLLCQLCGLEFKSISVFKTHENEHLGSPKYACPQSNCNKKFYGLPALRNHTKGCHSVMKHVCEKCGKTFSTAERAKIHSRRHFERTVRCLLCPQMFFTKSDLGPHMKHHKTWPWKCSKCNMSFKSTRGLQQHSSATHGEKLTRYQLYQKSNTG